MNVGAVDPMEGLGHSVIANSLGSSRCSIYVPFMGGHSPDRTPRLRSLKNPGPGYVWLASCDGCGHMSGLPVRQLIARFGELHTVDAALFSLRCDECKGTKVSARLARLCDPGCGRQRG